MDGCVRQADRGNRWWIDVVCTEREGERAANKLAYELSLRFFFSKFYLFFFFYWPTQPCHGKRDGNYYYCRRRRARKMAANSNNARPHAAARITNRSNFSASVWHPFRPGPTADDDHQNDETDCPGFFLLEIQPWNGQKDCKTLS